MKHPKIGIRPTIDGRQGGVRESLEHKTMALAQAVADLISKNLKYKDGAPVECILTDSTIGRALILKDSVKSLTNVALC